MFGKGFIFLLATHFLIASDVKWPNVIDFGKFPPIERGYHIDFNQELWHAGHYAFNYAPEVTPIFAQLASIYQIETAIETGTFFGSTTVVLGSLFKEVHTIEAAEGMHQLSTLLLQEFTHVTCHLGNSVTVLKTLLPSLKGKPILFYLDAHWGPYWPLAEELEEISKTHKDNCIIVIDDFKVPRRKDIPYDYYNEHECSLEYVQGYLDKIFTGYTYHYLIPRSKLSRAKFIAIPKTWVSLH